MATRDADAKKIVTTWAGSAGASDRIDPGSATPAVVWENGWPASFRTAGGNEPKGEVFNEIFARITALCAEVNRRGCWLPWDGTISYLHEAHVIGSDGNGYRSVQDSLNQDPVGDTNNTYWERVDPGYLIESTVVAAIDAALGSNDWQTSGDSVPEATTGRVGTVELATVAEVRTGTDAGRVVTPAGLSGRTATTSRTGVVELATQTEVDAGTDTSRAVTPETLEGRLVSFFQ